MSVAGKDTWKRKVLQPSAKQATLPPGAVARTARPEQQRQKPHRVSAAAAAAAAASPGDALRVQTSQSEAGSTTIGNASPPRCSSAPQSSAPQGPLHRPFDGSLEMKPTYVIRSPTFLDLLPHRPNNCEERGPEKSLRGGGWPGLVCDVPLSACGGGIWRREVFMRRWGRRRRISPSGESELSGCVVASRKPVALAAW